MNQEKEFVIHPYTHKELAGLYNVSRRTFLKWLKPFASDLGPRIGNFYTTRQVEIIFDKLGLPSIAV